MRYHSEGYQPLFRCCLWSMVLLLAAGCAHPMPVSDRSAEENEMSDRNPSEVAVPLKEIATGTHLPPAP